MATRIPTRLSAAHGRRFGLTVGTAFAVLAGVAWWRDREMMAAVLGIASGFFWLGGLLVPTRMGPVERAWMRLAHAISKVTTPIVMGVIYLLVLAPVGWLRRTLAPNPLVHTASNGSFWQHRAEGQRRSGSLKRQF